MDPDPALNLASYPALVIARHPAQLLKKKVRFRPTIESGFRKERSDSAVLAATGPRESGEMPICIYSSLNPMIYVSIYHRYIKE